MTLHDMIQADSLSVFCNENDFAETVTYYARHGSARDIVVQVFRESIAIVEADGDTVLPMFEVHVANHATLGILSSDLNIGGDYFEFASRVGQDPIRKSITRLVNHDEGMIILECR